jgi:hypothetical protein
MRAFLIAMGIFGGFSALVAAIGALLPRAHVASRTLTVSRSPAEVWALITSVAAYPSWRSGVTHVTPLPARRGQPAWVEHGASGDIPFETLDAEPLRRLTVRVADEALPYGGTWTYDIAPAPEGAALTITEHGWVSNIIFRFASRLLLGLHKTLDVYLKNVAAAFGDKRPRLAGR